MGCLRPVGGRKPLAEVAGYGQRVDGASRPWSRETFWWELRGAAVEWRGEVAGESKEHLGTWKMKNKK